VRRPRVTLKVATSLDGRIALADGQSKWITGPAARQEVHRIRAAHDAVLTGIGTVLADNPLFTARDVGASCQPTRIVLDSHGRLPLDSALVSSITEAPLMVFHGLKVSEPWRDSLKQAGASVIAIEQHDAAGQIALSSVFGHLHTLGIGTVMIEAGAGVATSVLSEGKCDQIEWFRAPVILGGDGLAVFGSIGLTLLDHAQRWQRVRSAPCGEDLWETYERVSD
jgi:diaminohydroxyphosphoribosylaminopyrimidine deaminase / 5-amino-6-(5-phosphoribosylamino)uracil reductase